MGNRNGGDGFETGPAFLMIEQGEWKAHSGDSVYCVMYLPQQERFLIYRYVFDWSELGCYLFDNIQKKMEKHR